MKNFLPFVFVAVIFAACSKNNDPTPSGPSVTVSGSYNLSAFLLLNGSDTIYLPKLPVTSQNVTVSGTLAITQVQNSANFVDMMVTLKSTGSTDVILPLDSVEVRKNSSSYSLYLGTLQLGVADGNTVNFDVSQTGQRFRLAFNAQR